MISGPNEPPLSLTAENGKPFALNREAYNAIRRATPLPRTHALQAFVAGDPARFAGSLIVLASLLFVAMPGLDLSVSRWFAADAGGFPLVAEPFLLAIRDVNRNVPYLVLPALAIVLVVHAFSHAPWLLRPHKAVFTLVFYALGPGLFIQLTKFAIGRARPNQIVEFGGTLQFTPSWQISSECWRSCSFLSGESAMAFALLCLPLLLPAHLRRPMLAVLLPLVLIFSVNRIALGAHFLSDVVLAWLFMGWMMAWMWPAFCRASRRIDRFVIGAARRFTAPR